VKISLQHPCGASLQYILPFCPNFTGFIGWQLIDVEITTGQIYIITYDDKMPAAQKF
jgi:hypothetical protein